MRIRPLHFAAFLLALNLVQVAFTELTSDEGYYWFYSRSLEWGYAEHPPLVALMVRIGYALFPNELGVRLVNVILNALGVLLLFTAGASEGAEDRRPHLPDGAVPAPAELPGVPHLPGRAAAVLPGVLSSSATGGSWRRRTCPRSC